MQPPGCFPIPEHHPILEECGSAFLLHLLHQSRHALLSGLIEGDIALLVHNGQHQPFSHLPCHPHRLHDILQGQRHALGYYQDVELGGAFSRPASSGVDPEVRPARLDVVATLPQVLVDHIAELKAPLQG